MASWAIGGILIIFVALAYAEVACMLPRTGAVVRYPHLTHGGYLGFILSWAFLVSTVTTPAIEAEGVVTYASTYLPGLSQVADAESGTGLVAEDLQEDVSFPSPRGEGHLAGI